MKKNKVFFVILGFVFMALLFLQCQKEEILVSEELTLIKKSEPEAGNNLSFPVIWSDGFEKVLREPPIFGEAYLQGEWWHVWGEDPAEPTDPVFSCPPNELNNELCADGSVPGDGVSTVYRAYVQKDLNNIWQADNFSVTDPLNVDLIDWGDNLESIDWSTKSQVRTEIVLYENLITPVMQYDMRHVFGWGSNEVHGLQTDQSGEPALAFSEQATVYSHNARLTIQKLNVDKDSIMPGDLIWEPLKGWIQSETVIIPHNSTVSRDWTIINEPIFNMAVYEADDGPGNYNAEINVKGKIIYGYTWNVRRLNEGEGYYRITFSFDETGGVVPLNTYFDDFTEIILPIEESEPGPRGGTAIIDVPNNLTYMDIKIIKKSGGGGGGGQGGGGGHGN